MCPLRNIAMRDFQESVTTGQTHGQMDGQTDRRRTKWSLCAAMLCRRHNKTWLDHIQLYYVQWARPLWSLDVAGPVLWELHEGIYHLGGDVLGQRSVTECRAICCHAATVVKVQNFLPTKKGNNNKWSPTLNWNKQIEKIVVPCTHNKSNLQICQESSLRQGIIGKYLSQVSYLLNMSALLSKW